MKKTDIIFMLIIASALFCGCTTFFSKAGNAERVLTHEIRYSHKGSKSEGRSGYLNFKNVLLPDCFSTVVDGGMVYIFKSKNTTWGDDGYFPSDGEPAERVYPSVNNRISDEDISRGWCEVTGHYINAPAGWIFVKWSNGSAVLSPVKVDEFVKVKSIRLIPRNTMFSGKTLLR